MRLDHSTPVLGFTGEELLNRDTPESAPRPLTFRDLVIMALNQTEAQEQMGAELKARIFGLSMKFYRGSKVSLTVDEAALIKERAGKQLSPLAYGRLCQWLEGEEQTVFGPDDGDDEEDA